MTVTYISWIITVDLITGIYNDESPVDLILFD